MSQLYEIKNGTEISEQELVNFVAQSMTKKQMVVHLKKSTKIKQELSKWIFNQSLKQLAKVWSAFSKFIKQ